MIGGCSPALSLSLGSRLTPPDEQKKTLKPLMPKLRTHTLLLSPLSKSIHMANINGEGKYSSQGGGYLQNNELIYHTVKSKAAISLALTFISPSFNSLQIIYHFLISLCLFIMFIVCLPLLEYVFYENKDVICLLQYHVPSTWNSFLLR